MNDLGLTFDEETLSPGRHRRRRRKGQSGPGEPRRRGRSLTALLIVTLILGGLGAGTWWGVNWVREALTAPDYTGSGVGSVQIEVLPGQTAAQIAQTLYEAGVVASPQAFVEAAQADPDSRNIQPGVYELPQQLPAATALRMLLDLNNRLVNQVTIPEGLSSFRTFQLLSDQLGIPVEEFEKAAEDPIALGVPEWWFNRTDGKETPKSIEGFLFPSTYEFPPDPTAEQVLGIMVDQFLTVVERIGFVETVENERNIAPYEALIVASLAQAEAGVEEDLGRVARVAYNRIYVHGMPLEFDVTVNYWFELTGQETKSSAEMTQAELYDPENPYNRGIEGLVPTPINNPGQAALEAAMDPPPGDWLFFVAIDREGNSAFSATWDEFCQDVQKAIEAGILNDPC
ncbi:MAG TPA: endolytic transglycosylase MltG [Natronosporangium sp.]|nr:endolytic transglycosylase MltG [Natronosporangium sp.]